MTDKRLYFFGAGGSDGDRTMKKLLGGKGANLAEMAGLGLPVPPGFTISTEACLAYQREGALPDGLMDEVRESMARLEEVTGKRFGDPEAPLLVSVRSGAAISMPGMMDTVLNLGLNAEVADGLIHAGGTPRFARDAHRRLIQMFANVVDEVPGARFEQVLEDAKRAAGVEDDTELSPSALEAIIARYLEVYEEVVGRPFPTDPWEQLERCVAAVFSSWDNPRARTYRRLNRIPDDLGTAVNVQTMVFGNLGEDCGTGVGFTRDPATGEAKFYGEYLPNAQGEDVVAGIRTPLPVHADRAEELGLGGRSLEERFPIAFGQLMQVAKTLETHYRDVQDVEFTFEGDSLYLLQTRTAKRTGRSWLVTQAAMVAEGLVKPEEALARIPADSLSQVMAPSLGQDALEQAKREGRLLATGLNAGPGAASGKLAFTADEAESRAKAGETVILVREDTTPEDIHGMAAAAGILTARGGLTSHAAVVARGMGKPCVAGCSALRVDAEARVMQVGDRELGPEHTITIDGSTGQVLAGDVDIAPSDVLAVVVEGKSAEGSVVAQAFEQVMAWSDEVRELGVRTNADTPRDAKTARALGAEGIGLCRTEHMFFEEERILAVRRMILAGSRDEREEALAAIEPMQAEDFKGLFREMAGKPVTIRTLDPPLHEFLPRDKGEIATLAERLGLTVEDVQVRLEALHESNPMLGHRGCRLGIHYPEITRMQTRAILRAALEVTAEGTEVTPEIMIPLVGNVMELTLQKREVLSEAEKLFEATGSRVTFKVGTMIEVPRAALTAGEIAEEAEFFSFGTNDLTQMTLGVSRDDSGSFLPDYVNRGIYAADPFASLDVKGPGRLMRIAVEEGRETRPALKVGICGEHGGDPETIRFCHDLGMDYVSCSPYRVPIARLAAAQAALAGKSGG